MTATITLRLSEGVAHTKFNFRSDHGRKVNFCNVLTDDFSFSLAHQMAW